MSQPLDYKELLKKYMRAVSIIEGHDFTHLMQGGMYGLSTEEVVKLDEFSQENQS